MQPSKWQNQWDTLVETQEDMNLKRLATRCTVSEIVRFAAHLPGLSEDDIAELRRAERIAIRDMHQLISKETVALAAKWPESFDKLKQFEQSQFAHSVILKVGQRCIELCAFLNETQGSELERGTPANAVLGHLRSLLLKHRLTTALTQFRAMHRSVHPTAGANDMKLLARRIAASSYLYRVQAATSSSGKSSLSRSVGRASADGLPPLRLGRSATARAHLKQSGSVRAYCPLLPPI